MTISTALATEIQRLTDELAARKATRIADPSTAPLWRALYEMPTRRRRRKPTLAGVARQAAKAGIEVAGYEVRPDGSIRVTTGKPVGDIDTNDAASPDPKWN